MAGKGKRLSVVYSPTALFELDEIWEWNAERYGTRHATDYRLFLWEEIERLATKPTIGRPVVKREDLRYLLMKRATGGHGHVAVYRIDHELGVVTIAHVFHTSQDWQARVRRGKGA